MTLRTKEQLLEDASVGFPDGQYQGNTAAKVRDLIESLSGVGGGESSSPTNDGTPQGLIRLGGRRFQVDVNGDGTYMFIGQGNADIDIESDVEAFFLVNDIDTANYKSPATFTPGQQADNTVTIIDSPSYSGWDGTSTPLREGDIIKLDFDVTGGGTLSNINYYVFGIRVG